MKKKLSAFGFRSYNLKSHRKPYNLQINGILIWVNITIENLLSFWWRFLYFYCFIVTQHLVWNIHCNTKIIMSRIKNRLNTIYRALVVQSILGQCAIVHTGLRYLVLSSFAEWLQYSEKSAPCIWGKSN